MTDPPDAGDRPERRSRGRVGVTRVLVVDDSTAIRRILRRSLEAAGYSVAEAADGQAALDACRTQVPDLVLLDVDMPVMDGPTALRAMRQDERLTAMPVLFLTARTGGAEVAAGLQLGAQDYIRKPCEAAELVARVEGALRTSARQAQLQELAIEAQLLSTIDALTGLGNRRQFDRRVEDLCAIVGSNAPVAVAMVDIDRFKLVNDAEGHPIGDLVLRVLAGRMRSVVVDPNLLVRWGGEEFMVLAPRLDDTPLLALGERIRASAGSSPFALGGGRLLDITVSVGCASGTLGALTSLIEHADESLYEAKHRGRNQVVLYGSSLTGPLPAV